MKEERNNQAALETEIAAGRPIIDMYAGEELAHLKDAITGVLESDGTDKDALSKRAKVLSDVLGTYVNAVTTGETIDEKKLRKARKTLPKGNGAVTNAADAVLGFMRATDDRNISNLVRLEVITGTIDSAAAQIAAKR